MGVPITFMDKYNPGQFDIIGCSESEGRGFSNGLRDPTSKTAQPTIDGRKVYNACSSAVAPDTMVPSPWRGL